MRGVNLRVRYLHSDIDSLERVKILRDLRLGEFDVLVGINLLREGLDLPEVSLVVVLDADKQGIKRLYRKQHKILLTMDCNGTHLMTNISQFIEPSIDEVFVIKSQFL